MSDPGFTKDDLALFVDLERAAKATGVSPCLIGAGAIQLGTDLQWRVRLSRQTMDWDFAVRIATWKQYEELAARLVSGKGGFVRAREPHRFRHRAGGILDVVPHGALEEPPGTIKWSDGTAMDTTGFGVLDEHHECHQFGPVELRTASLVAILGLKVLAYDDRRPGVTRDIADVHAILRQAEDSVAHARIVAEGLERLGSEEVRFTEIGAYLLGRDVGRAFQEEAMERMLTVLDGVETPETFMVGDVLRSSSEAGVPREHVVARMRAFRLGIMDR